MNHVFALLRLLVEASIRRADSINAAEPLDDADGVPVNVVVDKEIAVLKVLSLTDAIGGDEEINVSLSSKVFRAFLRSR